MIDWIDVVLIFLTFHGALVVLSDLSSLSIMSGNDDVVSNGIIMLHKECEQYHCPQV